MDPKVTASQIVEAICREKEKLYLPCHLELLFILLGYLITIYSWLLLIQYFQ